MMCPVCKRELAPTLSICLTCGAMMNDTVREELETKITSNSGGLSPRPAAIEPPRPEFLVSKELPKPHEIELRPSPRPLTAELARKHTSPTLVEFQTTKATLPDWRLQLQNSVRQRGIPTASGRQTDVVQVAVVSKQPQTSGANALKLEIESVPQPLDMSNPRLASAMKRIEESRRAFMPATGRKAAGSKPLPDIAQRKFPFDVVNPTEAPSNTTRVSEPAVSVPKPKLVSALKIEKKPFDTNKLPKLDTVIKEPKNLGTITDGEEFVKPLFEELAEEKTAASTIEVAEDREIFAEMPMEGEIDDLAPFSMRFGSGLFDLIIGGFATLIILSPFMMGGGSWASVSGVLTMVAGLSIFMFLYLTASLAFWGRTFGMRIFSLELIDADANVYPTTHQAAVSSAVYLLSMALGGLGFLTVLFNEEKRAVHDIVSGTLLIRDI